MRFQMLFCKRILAKEALLCYHRHVVTKKHAYGSAAVAVEGRSDGNDSERVTVGFTGRWLQYRDLRLWVPVGNMRTQWTGTLFHIKQTEV